MEEGMGEQPEMKEREKYLKPDWNDPTHTRLIDRRDGSVWPAYDTGYRHTRKGVHGI